MRSIFRHIIASVRDECLQRALKVLFIKTTHTKTATDNSKSEKTFKPALVKIEEIIHDDVEGDVEYNVQLLFVME